MWISVEDVVKFTGLKPKHLNLEKTDENGLTSIVDDWILQSQSLIESYTNRKYTEESVPDAVKNVCLRLTSNMVTLAIQKRDSPIIKVNDWSIQTVGSDVFTSDLKEDLKPFIRDKSRHFNRLGVFAITGKKDDGWC